MCKSCVYRYGRSSYLKIYAHRTHIHTSIYYTHYKQAKINTRTHFVVAAVCADRCVVTIRIIRMHHGTHAAAHTRKRTLARMQHVRGATRDDTSSERASAEKINVSHATRDDDGGDGSDMCARVVVDVRCAHLIAPSSQRRHRRRRRLAHARVLVIESTHASRTHICFCFTCGASDRPLNVHIHKCYAIALKRCC